MFALEERDEVRRRLLALAEADESVVAAAITGSYAVGAGDEWSDVDLAFGIRGDLPAALEHWTELLYRDVAALHHWDLPCGSTVYRVFLLPRWLEVDIAFTPAAEFGPLGPNWHTVFGETVERAPAAPPRRDDLAGLAWHHVLHARACIERGKPWQAEYWISGVREQVLALACLRLGHTTRYAKGADLLPPGATPRSPPGCGPCSPRSVASRRRSTNRAQATPCRRRARRQSSTRTTGVRPGLECVKEVWSGCVERS